MMQIDYRIGNGVDVHPMVCGREFVLGGISINNDKGCSGHSDGDVLVHSIMDALLGATNQGDIGDQFPSSDLQYKDIHSASLLPKIIDIIKPWKIVNLDSTIILQTPILKPHITNIKKSINSYLHLDSRLSIKATTTDHLGFIGNGEGIAVITTCLLTNR